MLHMLEIAGGVALGLILFNVIKRIYNNLEKTKLRRITELVNQSILRDAKTEQ